MQGEKIYAYGPPAGGGTAAAILVPKDVGFPTLAATYCSAMRWRRQLGKQRSRDRARRDLHTSIHTHIYRHVRYGTVRVGVGAGWSAAGLCESFASLSLTLCRYRPELMHALSLPFHIHERNAFARAALLSASNLAKAVYQLLAHGLDRAPSFDHYYCRGRRLGRS